MLHASDVPLVQQQSFGDEAASLRTDWPAERRAVPPPAPLADTVGAVGTRTGVPRNHLLAALPGDEYAALADHLERVTLPAGRVLAEQGVAVTHLHFPESVVAALVLVPRDGGKPVEVTTIGREGMLGISHVLGDDVPPARTVTRVGGTALRISVEAFTHAVAELPSLRRLLERYADALLWQLAQSALCVQSHSLERRLATLFLQVQDQVGSDRLPLTHEQLGLMLGVRRAGVTQVAVALRTRGVINYQRGKVVVQDRRSLLAACCGCYESIRAYHGAVAS